MAAMTSAVTPADPAELDAIVELIADEQARPDRNITYLGLDTAGIRAELDDLDPPWSTTVRVARADGVVVGATVADWDDELGRAWIQGPWVAGEDETWSRWARALVDAALVQLPPAIADFELAGTVENGRLADLAAELGWPATEVNYAYALDVARVAEWDDDTRPAAPVREAAAGDADAIRPLHDAEFPATYLPTERLLAEAAAGERIAIVTTDADGDVTGYASGKVNPDGDGYIDFVAVDPAARGTGAGRTLVTALSRRLAPDVTTGRINLTVQEHRSPARALYARLGFHVDVAFVGYRKKKP